MIINPLTITAAIITAVFLISLGINLYAAPAGDATGRTDVVLAKAQAVSLTKVLKDVVVMPGYALLWLLGKLWLLLRVVVAAAVMGFVHGASLGDD